MKLEIGNTHLYQYRDAIDRGDIVAGIEMVTLLDKLLAEIGEPEYVYDTSEAMRRIHFMENCIRLTKSPFYGKPMVLMAWQKAFVEVEYSFKMADTGYDRFKKTLFLISRKNTKSETCSALANCDMILGLPGSDIVCASNDDNQSAIVYEAIDTMRLLMDPDSKLTWRNQKGIKCKDTNSKIFKMSDRMRNKEGRNIDVGYVDEAHEMLDDSIVKPIEQSQSLKDNPKLFILTTEGFVNGGYLDGLLVYARRVLSGEDDGPAAKRFLPWLYTQDSEQEVWQDPRSWEKSNPTLGTVKKREYIVEQLDLASKSKSDRMYVLAKDFNIKQSNAQAWLMSEDYGYEATFEVEDFRGALCLGAVDLAETTDLTNAKILLMKPNDPVKYVYSHYWIPESKLSKSDDEGSGAHYREWCEQGLMT
ncbi:MAG: terminase TerL endonuclease subunit, partial [Bacteroides sp.]